MLIYNKVVPPFVYQLDFVLLRNSSGRDTLRKDHLSYTYKKISDTTNSRATNTYVARTSKFVRITPSIMPINYLTQDTTFETWDVGTVLRLQLFLEIVMSRNARD